MLKSILVGLMALSLAAGAGSAQGKMDCGTVYKGLWDKLEPERYAKMSAEQLARVSRMALRAYDACQAGDEREAEALFERVALWGNDPDQSTGPFNPNQPSR